jgi:hypothetical protein
MGKYVNYPRIEDVRGVLDRGRGNRRLRPEGVIYNVARLLDSSHLHNKCTPLRNFYVAVQTCTASGPAPAVSIYRSPQQTIGCLDDTNTQFHALSRRA